MGNLKLTSSAFEDGGEIPRECGYKNGNIPPPFTISGVPAEAKSQAIIMDDPDAMGAVGKVWVHWLFYQSTHIQGPSDLEPVYGKTDFGEIGYGGPAPPDKRHTYVFKAYALNVKLDLKEGYSKQELEDAMKDHIIAKAKLTGTFAP